MEGKWRQVGTKIDQKSMPVAKRDFLLNRALPAAGLEKWRSGGPSWEQKPIKNRSKFEVQDGVPLGIDF